MDNQSDRQNLWSKIITFVSGKRSLNTEIAASNVSSDDSSDSMYPITVSITFQNDGYIPPGHDEFSLDLIEEPLIEAIERTDFGVYDGNGFDLENGSCDIWFYLTREHVVAAIQLFQATLKSFEVPNGTLITVQYPEEDMRPTRVLNFNDQVPPDL